MKKIIIGSKIFFFSIFFFNIENTSLKRLYVDFNKSIIFHAHEKTNIKNIIKKSNHWKKDLNILRNHYRSVNFINKKINNEIKIPKIIHQIWLGSPFPEKYKKWQESWKKFNPDWEYKLWTDEDIKKLNLINQKWYDCAKNYGEKSDIARYEILDRFGGLYIDVDFECLKNFDLLHYICDFYVGIQTINVQHLVNNALIASMPNHPLLKILIKKINLLKSHKNYSLQKNEVQSTITTTGPGLLTSCITNYIVENKKNNVLILPPTYFYPVPFPQNNETKKSKYIKPQSFAVHYWAGSWKPKNMKK